MKAAVLKSLQELKEELQREAEKKRGAARRKEGRRFVKDELARLDKVERKIKARKKKAKQTPKLVDPIASSGDYGLGNGPDRRLIDCRLGWGQKIVSAKVDSSI